MATGVKIWPAPRWTYFCCFLRSAWFATALASATAIDAEDGAYMYVSGHVASQTRSCPHLHGATVIPSGRFPSARARPDGSKRDGMCAADKALLIMSFNSA